MLSIAVVRAIFIDFICESLFSEQNVSCDNEKINVENMKYDAVLVPNCDILIHTVNYRGALVKVFVDGDECGVSAFSPYAVRAKNISAGRHTVELELFGTRINTFGGLHNITKPDWINSAYWRTTGDNWCYEYMLWENGILSAPRIEILNGK